LLLLETLKKKSPSHTSLKGLLKEIRKLKMEVGNNSITDLRLWKMKKGIKTERIEKKYLSILFQKMS